MPKRKPYAELVAAVERVAEAAEAMQNAGCTRRMIVTLLHDSTKVPKRQIEAVLQGIDTLADTFLETEENG